MQDPDLWERINHYDFPQGFEEKLAAQFGGWKNKAHALREEYRRFIYLAAISPNEVTPSEQIDRVWHLHLSYTRDYWENFCPLVLERELHHDPCESLASMPRYNAQYAATLDLYRREFNQAPPSKEWPTKAVWKRVWAGLAIAVVGLIIGVWGIALGEEGMTFRYSTAVVLLFGGLCFAVFSAPPSLRGSSGAGCGGGGCGGGGCGGGC
ncbi:MAG: hypothetical protein ABJ251_16830 [Paracoccaceae bacterium]